MVTRMMILFLALMTAGGLFAQTPSTEMLAKRKEKLEQILRIQDTRTPHNSKLLEYLSDADPEVCYKATFAFGSIQDTSVLHLLLANLTNREKEISEAAAFAIGQTATQLSKKGKEKLEHELIWVRYDDLARHSAQAAGRLIEEIGKFGTDVALKDLMLRFGTQENGKVNIPLVMSIARFAIRNIARQEATLYLISLAKNNETVPWQVMYALQRLGNNQDIRNNLAEIVSHYRDTDALTKNHLAILLGKLKDAPTSIEPLMKLAEFDSDWRVRVSALRALGNFSLNERPDILEVYRRSFFDKNEYIGQTAIEVLGNTDLKEQEGVVTVSEAFAQLRKFTENKNNSYLWHFQAAAAYTLARLTGKDAAPFININQRQDRQLQTALLTALGETGDITAAPILEMYLTSDVPILARNALDALSALTHKHTSDSVRIENTYKACLQLVTHDDVAVVTTAAEILTDSMFMHSESVQPLIDRLSELRVPDDIEAIHAICSALGKLNDKRAVDILEETMDMPDQSVALAAANALESITGKNYKKELPEWVQPLYTDFDFKYLEGIPETVKVKIETTRGDIHAELYKDIAPFTIMSILKLTSQKGYYRGLFFHRVVMNFVIQGGDPRGDGWGGPGYAIRSEFSDLPYDTGTLGMASAGKDTEGSQFFITQSPQPHLDGKYTIFGKVVKGMDVVNKIRVDDRILDLKMEE